MLPRAKTGIVLLCNRLNAGKVIDKMWQELNDCKTGKFMIFDPNLDPKFDPDFENNSMFLRGII